MTEYICKCGRKLQRSTQSETTGNKLDGYAPGHECFGCPYVVPITRWENGHFVPEHYECVASKELRYETYASLFSFDRDSTAGHILSLDFDFLRRVAAECDKHEATISLNRDKGGQMFHYKSKYRPDGRFDFTIYPTQNKAGANAKRAIFEKFFTDGGARKDLTPEQEKEKILNDIEQGIHPELPQAYTPGDEYVNSTNTVRMRVTDVSRGGDPLYQVQRNNGSGWGAANSSFYPHLENAVATLAAFVRIDGLIPAPESNDPPESSPTFPAAATAAAEEPASPLAEPAPANTTAEPAAGGSEPEERALAANPVTYDLSMPGAFDFSALGDLAEQAAEADAQFNAHYGRAQDEYLISCIYMARIHSLTARAGRYGGGTWTAWCKSKGISEGSARTMVQNGESFKSATIADLKLLPAMTRKDINLIAREGKAPELLAVADDSERVKDLLAQLKAKSDELAAEKSRADSLSAEIGAREEKISELLEASEQADQRANQAETRIKGLEDSYRSAHANEEFAIRRAADAEQKATRFAQIKDAALDQVKQAQAKLEAERSDSRRAAAQLQQRIRELEARPVEVVAADPDEVNRLAEEKAQAIAAQRSAKSTRDRDALQERIEELEELLDDAAQDQIANTQALAVQAVAACDGLMESLFGKILFLPDKEYLPAKRIVESFYAKLGWVLDNNDWPDNDDWALNHSGDESDDEPDEEEAEEDE